MNVMSESKVALVTGGASGLGRAAALLFAAKGCNVCIADVQDDKGHEACKHIEGKFAATCFGHFQVPHTKHVKLCIFPRSTMSDLQPRT